MSTCYAKFWQDTSNHGNSGGGPYKVYQSPTTCPDLSDHNWDGSTFDNAMDNDLSFVDTGSSTWVMIYTQKGYRGRMALISPNTGINLNNLKDSWGQNFDDDVESFRLYDTRPVDGSRVVTNFVALYPGSHRDSSGDTHIDFYAQDSQYRIYGPVITQTGNRVDFTINLDHVQSEHDDHATVTFSMNTDGDFVDHIQVSYVMADASQIPDWAVKLIDGAIDVGAWAAKAVCDGAEIVITDGVGVVATAEVNELIDYAAKALTFCVDHLNTVLAAIFKLQDNGGTMYFSSIVSHSIARLVLAYYQELKGAWTSKLTFNESRFLSPLGASGWINPGTSGGKSNPYVNFVQNGYDYRAFYPDNSFLYNPGGAVSSVCIGATTSTAKDDHLTLQAGYDPQGNLFSVAAGADLYLNSAPSGYKAPSTGVITYNANRQLVHILPGTSGTVINYPSIVDAYRDILNTALNNAGVSISDQQRHLVDASVRVLNAMTDAIG